MEFILIGESKLKIMLSAEELKGFEVEACELDYATTETKRMFWEVLARAKRQTGFDTDGQRILVRLFPSKKGGCELFVTKLGEKQEPDEGEERSTRTAEERAAYSFSTLEAMLQACRRLREIGFSGESSAYLGEDDGRGYLFLTGEGLGVLSPLSSRSFLGEYGSHESVGASLSRLGEHGKCLCPESAVEILGAL